MTVRHAALGLLLCATVCLAQESASSLADLARRTWEADLAGYAAGDVPLLTAHRMNQHLFRAEQELAEVGEEAARRGFHERLERLHALAGDRDLDRQTIACIRAVVAVPGPGPSASSDAAIAAVGSLLAAHREQLLEGAGDPEAFHLWSHQLRSLQTQRAAGPLPEGGFEFAEEDPVEPPWYGEHRERLAWLSATLRAQGRAPGARYYGLSVAREEDLDEEDLGPDEEAPGGGPHFFGELAPDRRDPALRRAAQAGFDAAWSAFRAGGDDVLALDTWSRRLGGSMEGLQTLEGTRAHAQEHLGRMRVVEEAARARPDEGASARVRLEAALLVALAEARRREVEPRGN